MLRLLDDPDWEKIDGGFTEGRRRRRIINARYKIEPTHCLKCGKTRGLGVHGRKTSEYFDQAEEERFVIRVTRLRYRCRKCGKTFFQPLAGLSENRRMTSELEEALVFEAGRDTFSAVAGRYGVDDKTVARVTRQKYPLRGRSRQIYGPPGGLGIHVVKVDGRYRTVLIDLTHLIIIDVLPSVLPKVIEGWLKRLVKREKRLLLSVCLDPQLHPQTRDAVKAGLGKKVLLIAPTTKFSALADAAASVVSKKGDQNTTKRAQEARSRFLEIYESKSPEKCRAALEAWRLSLGVGIKRAFGPLRRALDDWEAEFCSNFDPRAASATMQSDHIYAEVAKLERRQRSAGFDEFYRRVFKPKIEDRRFIRGERAEGPLLDAPAGLLICETCRWKFGPSKVRGKFTLEGGLLAWLKYRDSECGCWTCEFSYADKWSARKILTTPVRSARKKNVGGASAVSAISRRELLSRK